MFMGQISNFICDLMTFTKTHLQHGYNYNKTLIQHKMNGVVIHLCSYSMCISERKKGTEQTSCIYTQNKSRESYFYDQ